MLSTDGAKAISQTEKPLCLRSGEVSKGGKVETQSLTNLFIDLCHKADLNDSVLGPRQWPRLADSSYPTIDSEQKIYVCSSSGPWPRHTSQLKYLASNLNSEKQ